MGKPNDDVAPWFVMRKLHTTERPRTTFVDMEDALQVVVRAAPREVDAKAYLDPALTCHNPEPLSDEDMALRGFDTLAALSPATGGQTLNQVGEGLYYSLRMQGLSRILSHQLVRARVGWTFSETCTGDHDWRHGAFLIPRPWMRNEQYLETQIKHMLLSKHLYAADVDGALNWESLEPIQGGGALIRVDHDEAFDDGSPNVARFSLHPNLRVFVHARVNLIALSHWYGERSCPMTQMWPMTLLAERVREAVVAATPWAAPAFKRPCDAGRCRYLLAYKSPLFQGNYYRPDDTHAKHMEDWNPKSFWFPDKTRQQMESGLVPFASREYEGTERTK